MNLVCKAISTPLGPLLLAANDDGLAGVWFEDQQDVPRFLPHQASRDLPPRLPQDLPHQVARSQRWLDLTEHSLNDYFAGRAMRFEAPRVHLWGTPFERRVWEQLAALPWGVSTTYGALAAALEHPRAARPVGAAVGRNPWSIVVPCHRVLGAQGRLTGYSGGLWRKRELLALEGLSFRP